MGSKTFMPLCFVAVGTAISLGGCADNVDSDLGAEGTHFVELYNGGKIVRQWHSVDVPAKKSWDSDFWYFTDVATDRLVRVSGTVVITTLEAPA